jgi:hypothetical protein
MESRWLVENVENVVMLGNVVIRLVFRLPNAVGLNCHVSHGATEARDGRSSRNGVVVSVGVVVDNEVLLDTASLRSDCMQKTRWMLVMMAVCRRRGHHPQSVLL